MNRTKRMIIIAGAGTALAAGLTVPVAAWATSPTPAPSSSSSETPGTATDGPRGLRGPHGGPGGPGGHGGPGALHGPGHHEEMAAKLAEILGVDKDKVTTALEEIRKEGGPGRPPKAPEQDEAEKAAPQDEPNAPQDEPKKAAPRERLAEALAGKLGISADKVVAALETLDQQHRAEAETAFAERLKEAVTAGTLTQAESDAVLKAYRAGLIPAGPRGR
ncbi:hypothetical protein ACFY3V_35835 [Streptosporangium sp. NPDC000095]|uniref:hypothetical protein n=1 Tax=Streptosporangium sp. NPDC000095 TaxID=3366184 RepID=UPI00367BB02C